MGLWTNDISVIESNGEILQTEAAHGTVTSHYLQHKNG